MWSVGAKVTNVLKYEPRIRATRAIRGRNRDRMGSPSSRRLSDPGRQLVASGSARRQPGSPDPRPARDPSGQLAGVRVRSSLRRRGVRNEWGACGSLFNPACDGFLAPGSSLRLSSLLGSGIAGSPARSPVPQLRHLFREQRTVGFDPALHGFKDQV